MNSRVRLIVIALLAALFGLFGVLVSVTTSEHADTGTALAARDKPTTSTTERATTSTSTQGLATAETTTSLVGGATATTVRQSARPVATAPPRAQTPKTTQPQPVKAAGPCNSGAGGVAANRIATLFCDHRANAGLPIMRRTAALDSVAQSWADQMAQKHETSPPPHNPSYQAQVYAGCEACTGVAENVGYWTDDEPDKIWQAWLDSPAHQPNIDDSRAGEYGIGVAYSDDGYLWVVHDFGRY